MQQPSVIRVGISGVYGAVDGGQKREADYQINKALRSLFNAGCRRMKIRNLPRTGDDLRFEVSGE